MDEVTDLLAIELSHLNKVKPVLLGDTLTKLEVIHDLSLVIPKGEVLALIGPSGSGKSTLLRMINRIEEPTSGSILLYGSDIQNMNVRKLRRRIGMVSQTPALLPGTIEENITYGPKLRGEPCDAAHFLDLVGLEKSLLQRPASALSIGQQQRMSIARALANNPEVLLLDEPTSALDQTAARNIINLICHLSHRLALTVIMVTHVMEHAKAVATRIALLVHGSLIEEGEAVEFFSDPTTEAGRKFLRGELFESGD